VTSLWHYLRQGFSPQTARRLGVVRARMAGLATPSRQRLAV